MKPRAGDGSAADAAAAARAWAENLGGGTGVQGRPSRQTCWAVWREDLAVFEVLQPRGDSLRSMGKTWRGRTMLHAEEGLWLVERGMLAVHPFSDPSKSQAPAGTPSASATGDTNNGDGEAEPCGSRLEAMQVEEMGEHHQGGEEKEDETARERLGASMGCSNGGGQRKQPKEEKEEEEEEEEEKVGQGRADCSTGSSTTKTDPAPSSAAGEAGPSKAGPSSRCSFSGKGAAVKPAEVLGSSESGGPAQGEQGHGRRKGGGRGGGRKRGPSGSTGSERDGGRATAQSMLVEDLHGSILPRAGVPWECYRAYAELKRRSYVVRRQPEDTIGHDDATPRAAALSWFEPTPTPTPNGTARSSKPVNREANNDARTGADSNNTTTSFPSSSSSSSSSSFSFSFSSSSLAPPSTGPPPSPVPVTFHVYNPPGLSSSSSPFRKRDPGPPDALLAVCRFGDPMPEHGSLVALAERHADMKNGASGGESASTSTTTGNKPAERRRQEGKTGSAARGELGSEEQAMPGRGDDGGGRERSAAAEEESGRRDRPCGGEAEKEREGRGLSGQRCGKRSGGAEGARNLGRSGGGDCVGIESGLGVLLPGTARGGGRERSSLGQERGGLVVNQSRAEEVSSVRKGGGEADGDREGVKAGKGGDRKGLWSAAAQRTSPPGAVTLAVVSYESGVQLFDVCLHDASEAAEPLGAS